MRSEEDKGNMNRRCKGKGHDVHTVEKERVSLQRPHIYPLGDQPNDGGLPVALHSPLPSGALGGTSGVSGGARLRLQGCPGRRWREATPVTDHGAEEELWGVWDCR